jgi:COP9 signalosome complex subunit 1
LELTNQFNSVLSAEDIALYGSLLGLASLDRDSLHTLVMEGAFKARLELVPSVRDALRHYSLAEYGPCMSILQGTVRKDISLDIHLHPHVNTLLDMIRDRCIVQYFSPYSSVSLEKMGAVFGHDVVEMEKIVAKLIQNGAVEGVSLGVGARINAIDKTLSVFSASCVERKARRRARVKAAKMGVEFVRNAEGMIMRVACFENGIVLQAGRKSARARDAAGRPVSDRMVMDAHEDSDSSYSHDAMEVDEHHPVANPNDFD